MARLGLLLESVESEFDDSFQDVPDLVNFENIKQEIVEDTVSNVTSFKNDKGECFSVCKESHKEYFSTQNEALVKIETNPKTNDFKKIQDWQIKNEELDIKELIESESGTPSSGTKQERYNEYNKHKCHICDYSTRKKSSLKRHQLQHEGHNEVFRCIKCDYVTIKKRYFTLHLQRHEKIERGGFFKCYNCGYETIEKGNLRRHMLQHGDHKEIETFKCEKCNYKTINEHCLSMHLLKHERTKIEGVYKCNKCEYQTIKTANINRHLQRHERIEKGGFFKCGKCEYRTIEKRYLQRHLCSR